MTSPSRLKYPVEPLPTLLLPTDYTYRPLYLHQLENFSSQRPSLSPRCESAIEAPAGYLCRELHFSYDSEERATSLASVSPTQRAVTLPGFSPPSQNAATQQNAQVPSSPRHHVFAKLRASSIPEGHNLLQEVARQAVFRRSLEDGDFPEVPTDICEAMLRPTRSTVLRRQCTAQRIEQLSQGTSHCSSCVSSASRRPSARLSSPASSAGRLTRAANLLRLTTEKKLRQLEEAAVWKAAEEECLRAAHPGVRLVKGPVDVTPTRASAKGKNSASGKAAGCQRIGSVVQTSRDAKLRSPRERVHRSERIKSGTPCSDSTRTPPAEDDSKRGKTSPTPQTPAVGYAAPAALHMTAVEDLKSSAPLHDPNADCSVTLLLEEVKNPSFGHQSTQSSSIIFTVEVPADPSTGKACMRPDVKTECPSMEQRKASETPPHAEHLVAPFNYSDAYYSVKMTLASEEEPPQPMKRSGPLELGAPLERHNSLHHLTGSFGKRHRGPFPSASESNMTSTHVSETVSESCSFLEEVAGSASQSALLQRLREGSAKKVFAFFGEPSSIAGPSSAMRRSPYAPIDHCKDVSVNAAALDTNLHHSLSPFSVRLTSRTITAFKALRKHVALVVYQRYFSYWAASTKAGQRAQQHSGAQRHSYDSSHCSLGLKVSSILHTPTLRHGRDSMADLLTSQEPSHEESRRSPPRHKERQLRGCGPLSQDPLHTRVVPQLQRSCGAPPSISTSAEGTHTTRAASSRRCSSAPTDAAKQLSQSINPDVDNGQGEAQPPAADASRPSRNEASELATGAAPLAPVIRHVSLQRHSLASEEPMLGSRSSTSRASERSPLEKPVLASSALLTDIEVVPLANAPTPDRDSQWPPGDMSNSRNESEHFDVPLNLLCLAEDTEKRRGAHWQLMDASSTAHQEPTGDRSPSTSAGIGHSLSPAFSSASSLFESTALNSKDKSSHSQASSVAIGVGIARSESAEAPHTFLHEEFTDPHLHRDTPIASDECGHMHSDSGVDPRSASPSEGLFPKQTAISDN